jgi:hypothetical protein
MALSAKMLALIQKIEAADEVHFAGLREDVKKEAQGRAQSLEKKRANLRVARAVQKAQNERHARSGARKKPKG